MNPIYTLLFGLIFIAIGFLIGALVFGWRSRTLKETAEEKPGSFTRRGEARLWRDPLSQRLMIEMDGEVYKNPGEMGNELRLRLAHLVGEAGAWMPRKASLETQAARPVASPLLEVQLQPEKGKPVKEAATQSIAAQIDKILQGKLEGSPLAGRGIKLVELPEQGLVVMVGLEKYTDLTLVPDEDVRSVIGEAVAEWEEKSI
jgi:hypothetical protein